MSDLTSLSKARYCRSILTTASNCPDDNAKHLVDCLATEYLTPLTSSSVKVAERDALAAIYTLSERMRDRSVSSAAGEWKSANEAVLRWISSAS